MKLENCAMLLPQHQVGYGDLEFEDGIITAITLKPMPGELTSSHLILPGLINCHGHTAMTLVRGFGGGLPLKRWLEEAIFPVEAKMHPEEVYAGNLWGIAEMFASGTTTVADMYDFPETLERALAETGMRGLVNRVGLSLVPGRLEECIRFAEGRADRHLCVHSEYLTDEPFCRALAEANARLGRPVHFHCSETEAEHSECIRRHGKTPLAYLASTGLLDHGGYAAHCVWCTDDDFRLMAAKGVALVHNPTSNLKLASGMARVARACELGVTVALGTDGTASNDNLNLFEEMHLASLLAKGVAKDPTALSAWQVIDMATVNGARALQLEDTGLLAVGKRADLVIVELNRPHLIPALDIPNLVVNSMQASDVVMTIAGGKLVYDHGHFPTMDIGAAKNGLLKAVRSLGL